MYSEQRFIRFLKALQSESLSLARIKKKECIPVYIYLFLSLDLHHGTIELFTTSASNK